MSDGAPSSSEPRPDGLSAIQALESLLTSNWIVGQAWALNDPRAPDRMVVQFLHTLDPAARVRSLAMCDRPAVLVVWGSGGLLEEREAVAGNAHTPREVQLVLLADPEPAVRVVLVDNPALDLDVRAGLLGDQSCRVQEGVATYLTWWREETADSDDTDAAGGSEESLRYLYEMVPAAEEEECREDLAREARDRAALALQPRIEPDELADEQPPSEPKPEPDDDWRLSLPAGARPARVRAGRRAAAGALARGGPPRAAPAGGRSSLGGTPSR